MSAQLIAFPFRFGHTSQSRNTAVARRPVPSAGSVLDYLKRVREYAELKHERETAQEYERAWRFAFEFTHGPLPRRQPSPTLRAPAATPNAKAVPKWKLAVLARPMRKVVATHSSVKRGDGGCGWQSYTVLTLECGHAIEDLSILMGDKPAYRRRCWECAA